MPFCTQCGTQVGNTDIYCAGCGMRQATPGSFADSPYTASAPRASAAGSGQDFLASMSARNAILFCYIPVIGWIAAIVVLATDRFRNDMTVRFHAFQGLYLFVAWLIVGWVLSPVFALSHVGGVPFVPIAIPKLLKAVIFGIWIFMLVKANQGVDYRLPIFGELAERSAAEQR